MDNPSDWISEAQEAMANLDPKKFAEWMDDNTGCTREDYIEELLYSMQAQNEKYKEVY